MSSWVAALQETTEESLKYSNPSSKKMPVSPATPASADSISTFEPVPNAMNIILGIPGNNQCADCGSTVGKLGV